MFCAVESAASSSTWQTGGIACVELLGRWLPEGESEVWRAWGGIRSERPERLGLGCGYLPRRTSASRKYLVYTR
jgi:hypothetical protein